MCKDHCPILILWHQKHSFYFFFSFISFPIIKWLLACFPLTAILHNNFQNPVSADSLLLTAGCSYLFILKTIAIFDLIKTGKLLHIVPKAYLTCAICLHCCLQDNEWLSTIISSYLLHQTPCRLFIINFFHAMGRQKSPK